MRRDTPLGPVWLLPDKLGEKAAMHYARLELMWPDLDGFKALHAGPPHGGAFVVYAPREALKTAGLPIGTAAELPIPDASAFPPLQYDEPLGPRSG